MLFGGRNTCILYLCDKIPANGGPQSLFCRPVSTPLGRCCTCRPLWCMSLLELQCHGPSPRVSALAYEMSTAIWCTRQMVDSLDKHIQNEKELIRLRRFMPAARTTRASAQFCLRRELPCSKVVRFCLRRKLPVPGTKRGAILYLCGEY